MHGPYLSTCGYIRCVRGMRDGSTLGLSGRLLGGALPVRRSMEIDGNRMVVNCKILCTAAVLFKVCSLL